jgi:hypothetical protein
MLSPYTLIFATPTLLCPSPPSPPREPPPSSRTYLCPPASPPSGETNICFFTLNPKPLTLTSKLVRQTFDSLP